MKSRGAMFHGAFVRRLGHAFSSIPQLWDALFGDWQDGFTQAAAEYDKACAQLPDDVEAFVASVEASFSDACECGHSIPDDHHHGECEIDCCECPGLPELSDELETRMGQLTRLVAIVREQGAKLARIRKAGEDAANMAAELSARENERNDIMSQAVDVAEEAGKLLEQCAAENARLRNTLAYSIDQLEAANGRLDDENIHTAEAGDIRAWIGKTRFELLNDSAKGGA